MDTKLEKAKDFKLQDSEGKLRSLGEFKGKWLILYFYPKDNTPGCSLEACSFRDESDELSKLGAVIVGVSKDDPSSHLKFKAKYSLGFILLSDPELKVIKEYDAWGKNRFGIIGVKRVTYIINPAGFIEKIYRKVLPLGHGREIKNDLTELINKYNSNSI